MSDQNSETPQPSRPRRRSFNRPIRTPPRISGRSPTGGTYVRPIRPTPRRGQLFTWPHNVVASLRRPRPMIASPSGGGFMPSSPPRRPRPINKSKYEKMLKELTKSAIANNRNARTSDNKLVSSWMNESGVKSGKSNIPKNRRVFLMPDVTRAGVIKHVYDRKFINGMIESFETLPVSGRREVVENDDPFFTSPITQRKFSKRDVKAYPPTPNTKRLIRNRI